MIPLRKIYKIINHNKFDDALMVYGEKGNLLFEVKMNFEEFINLMQSPIEIEI